MRDRRVVARPLAVGPLAVRDLRARDLGLAALDLALCQGPGSRLGGHRDVARVFHDLPVDDLERRRRQRTGLDDREVTALPLAVDPLGVLDLGVGHLGQVGLRAVRDVVLGVVRGVGQDIGSAVSVREVAWHGAIPLVLDGALRDHDRILTGLKSLVGVRPSDVLTHNDLSVVVVLVAAGDSRSGSHDDGSGNHGYQRHDRGDDTGNTSPLGPSFRSPMPHEELPSIEWSVVGRTALSI